MISITNNDKGGVIVGGSAFHSGVIVSVKGRDGTSIQIMGSVATYGELPMEGNARGDLWIVEADGLGYFWSGFAWPPDGQGIEIRGPIGKTGVGIKSITLDGDALKFTYTDDSVALVTIPAIQAAADSAAQAAGSAQAAALSEDEAQRAEGVATEQARLAGLSAEAANQSKIDAGLSATAADGSAQAATEQVGLATIQAEAAAGSATAAATEAGKAKTQREAADAAAGRASTHESNARDSAGAAGASAQASLESAGASELSRQASNASAGAAAISESNAHGSELEAKRWAEEAASSVAGVATIEGLSGAVTLAQLNLDHVDNTRDMDKPVSTAQASADAAVLTSGKDYTDGKFGPLSTDLTNTMATVQQIEGNFGYMIAGANGPEGILVLGEDGKVMAEQLPSYVDDVLEFPTLADFPNPGEKGKIYTAEDTNQVYRWGGSAYVEVSPSPGSTDAVAEGQTNLYFTNARAVAAVKAGIQVPYPLTLAATLGTRKVGMTELVTGSGPLADAVTFSKMVLTFETADASGNTVVQILKNGGTMSGMTLTCSAAAQAGPIAGRTVTGSWSYAVGDVLTVQITGVGNTPGKGLTVSLTGKAAIA